MSPATARAGGSVRVMAAGAKSSAAASSPIRVIVNVLPVPVWPNATTAAGFSVTIARTDESARAGWSQVLQLNWLAGLAPT